jgi:hypothetical protein
MIGSLPCKSSSLHGPGGFAHRRAGEAKIGAFRDWNGPALTLVYTGYYLSGAFLSVIAKHLQGCVTFEFDEVVEVFAGPISTELLFRSIVDGQGQPAQFLIGAYWQSHSPRLAAVGTHTHLQPQQGELVSIGGPEPFAGPPIPWGTVVKAGAQSPERRVLRLLRNYIVRHPHASYDFPLMWLRETSLEDSSYGFVDQRLRPTPDRSASV